MLLAQLAVMFVGIVGDADATISKQLAPVVAHAHVATATMAMTDIALLTHHRGGSRALVQALHSDGVIGAELVDTHGAWILRVVVYDGAGELRSFDEMPLASRTLSPADLAILATKFDEVVAAVPAAAAQVTAAPGTKEPSASPVAPPVAPDAGDAVRIDEIEALTSPTDVAVGPSTAQTLHLSASVGFGVLVRDFAAGPLAIPNYATSPIGAIRFEAGARPTAHTTLTGVAERSLSMSTALADGDAPTSISRWEIRASYELVHGARLALAPMIGLGHRTFAIDSTDPMRSPDGDYQYAVLGASAAMPVGTHVTMRAHVAFEPVFGGTEAGAMAFGGARRWAIAAGLGIDVRPIDHLFARLAFDYQRFDWTWNAGERAQGGATDIYPSGILSVGAEY
ncbi:MAG: hypothetical protein NT062_12025 [Proteobacteria bacterium]|nr:hypothetical protein [Pseudomonadota bacterium]